MRNLRLAVTTVIVCLFVVLSLFTDQFWWFQKVNDWQTAFKDWGAGRGQFPTACLWATVHGFLSIVIGTGWCLTKGKSFESAKQYAWCLLSYSLVCASFLAIADIGSGWWMLIEGGRYIPLAWGAFLQPFLVGYLVILFCVVPPIDKSLRQPILPFNGQPAS